MKRRDFLKTAAAGAAAPVLSRFVWANAAERRILYYDRSTEYVHPPTVVQEDGTTVCGNALAALGQEDGFVVDSTKDPSVFDGDLSKYSTFVFYTCGNLDAPKDDQPGISPQGILNFYNAIRGGVGLLGIHSATDTWKTPGPLWDNQPLNERKGYTNLIG
ncbi:MAG: ThuA domain-containing protein, partial [Thermoguttaceae bacterium]|nr:ThuA domain-containing protein [Thermoguttaceae bacterium]